MAGWLTHLRIAENVIDLIGFEPDELLYYVGSIAPDAGELHYDETGRRFYVPARYITHWTDETKVWDRPIHFERFYNEYVQNEMDKGKKSFLYGYFIHLVTDALWIEQHTRPLLKKINNTDATEDELREMRKIYRAEAFNLENAFLTRNFGYHPFELIKSITGFDNKYLPYISSNDVNRIISRIVRQYDPSSCDFRTDHTYMKYDEYESMINKTVLLLKMILLAR
jgi:hypothetical protein